jgi:hypothetical protein
MLDSQTEIRHPHTAKVTRRGGKKHVDVEDPRTSVTIRDRGCRLVLFFDSLASDAALVEVRVLPDGKRFAPQTFVPQLPLYLMYARAAIAHDRGDAQAALKALRQAGTTRRGLGDDFYKRVALIYKALVSEGEPYPVKALAAHEHVSISAASRWITGARERGYLEEAEDGK